MTETWADMLQFECAELEAEVRQLKESNRRLRALLQFHTQTTPPLETRVANLVASLLEGEGIDGDD
jgi:hypothetical protein